MGGIRKVPVFEREARTEFSYFLRVFERCCSSDSPMIQMRDTNNTSDIFGILVIR